MHVHHTAFNRLINTFHTASDPSVLSSPTRAHNTTTGRNTAERWNPKWMVEKWNVSCVYVRSGGLEDQLGLEAVSKLAYQSVYRCRVSNTQWYSNSWGLTTYDTWVRVRPNHERRRAVPGCMWWMCLVWQDHIIPNSRRSLEVVLFLPVLWLGFMFQQSFFNVSAFQHDHSRKLWQVYVTHYV